MTKSAISLGSYILIINLHHQFKRQYVEDIATNEAEMAKVKAFLDHLNMKVENGAQITEEMSNVWNAAHDREWELEQELFDIERRWIQRNWTGQDHAHHELVMQNID